MKMVKIYSVPVYVSILQKYFSFPKFVSSKTLKRSFFSSTTLCFQPTPSSHPHLLKKGEIIPGIRTESFSNRRCRFLQILPKQTPHHTANQPHIAVIPSATTLYMSDDIPYFFRQKTDFLYLCGLKEPSCVLVLHKSPSSQGSTLFITKQSAHSERWEGKKLNPSEMTDFLGVDRTLSLDSLRSYLESFAKEHERFTLWYDHASPSFNFVNDTVRDFITSHTGRISVESPRPVLYQMRALKTPEEVELMRQSCEIAAKSLKATMRSSVASVPEAHLQAVFDFECRMRNADHLAFPPVVGGGERAHVIHYIENNCIVKGGEMVLMDAGCEFFGYCSDISRTWPVDGKFTEPQRELYEVVLTVQEELIEMCQSKMPLDDLYGVMCYKLGKGLQNLGALPHSAAQEDIFELGKELCPHHVGHYLGMDVHDCNIISRSIPLQPGMIVTIEPGLYISKDKTKIPEKYRGIGIRIEDDILITEEGYEVLTSDCPKRVDEIETLIRGNGQRSVTELGA